MENSAYIKEGLNLWQNTIVLRRLMLFVAAKAHDAWKKISSLFRGKIYQKSKLYCKRELINL